jgi:hypothetical protein
MQYTVKHSLPTVSRCFVTCKTVQTRTKVCLTNYPGHLLSGRATATVNYVGLMQLAVPNVAAVGFFVKPITAL